MTMNAYSAASAPTRGILDLNLCAFKVFGARVKFNKISVCNFHEQFFESC